VRIAIVAPLVTPIREPQLGGSQALLADIATGLTLRGHEVSVFAASGSEIAAARIVETGIDPEVLKPTLFRAGGPEQNGSEQAIEAFRRVYELVAAEQFDVVHNHAFDAPAIDLAVVDAPIVHTLHLPPSRSIAQALERARERGQSLVCACVSRWSARAWSKIVDVDTVLRNGVPVDQIPWSAEAGRGLLYAGRLSPEKGAAEAIDIARSAGIEITVVGNPYDERYASEQIEPHRGSEGVEIRGALARREVWELMAASRAVLCPALWDEPFGLVAAESQAAGTPVLAYDRGALSEVIVNGVTGALVDDASGAVNALRTVGSIDRIACRKHAAEHLSLDKTLDAHEGLYRRLVRASARSA
jgi:UDP-glucose:tetrahydrobiopterin glucosyltransferase